MALVLSYYNFACAPKKTEILKKILLAKFYGGDMTKASVMPMDNRDVLALLEVTREATEVFTIPVDDLRSMIGMVQRGSEHN